MLRFFEKNNSCEIYLDYPLTDEDTVALEKLFNKSYKSWNIEFVHLYSINTELVNLLYLEIVYKQKEVHLITRKYKLNRYLHQLGFKTFFVSMLNNAILDIKNIKLILIGGSAGSSQKIIEIVKQVTLENITLVIIQHVEASRTQIFDTVLQEHTKYKVTYAKENKRIQKGMIYIAPKDKHLKVENGYFILSDNEKYNSARPSISVSYESFSSYYKDKLLVIQECGYANDGVDKLTFLRQNGSKIILQDIDECEAKSMISHALKIGVHHHILNQEDIITYINLTDKKLTQTLWIEYLLDMILKRYGYDFKLYQREMLKRSLAVFMLKHGIKSLKNAIELILFKRSAFKGFFLDVSINITELFRKPESFTHTISLLKKNYKKNHSLKIWSAGCSSGEEVYSMAIILQHLHILKKSILYATDFNGVIIEEAKNALYSNDSYLIAKKNFKQIGLDANFDNFIQKNDSFISINENIRDKVHFFQHNLVSDSSFNEFDIIICKNVIIYFDNNLQKKVFQLFYDSLRFGGYIILGESEMVHTYFNNKFEQYSKNCKIFKKVA